MTQQAGSGTQEQQAAGPLAIIAGGGALPGVVAEAAAAAGRAVLILALEGEAGAAIDRYPHEWIKWGQFGRAEALAKAHGAREIVLAGSIQRRPDFSSIRLDGLALRSLPKILAIVAGGDDTVLSGAVKFIEGRGFAVRGPHEIAHELVAEVGCLTKARPDMTAEADIALAAEAARTIGRLDAGQAAVCVSKQVIALEGLEGTDRMLARVRELHESGRARWRGRAGVLAKYAKPQQDLRVDMPTIGPRTVAAVAEAGLAGIAIEAGKVMMLDRAALIAAADAAGLFVVGVAS